MKVQARDCRCGKHKCHLCGVNPGKWVLVRCDECNRAAVQRSRQRKRKEVSDD